MTGNIWLCLTMTDYENTVPTEVAEYYSTQEDASGAEFVPANIIPEDTTWRELNDSVLTPKFKLQRGPYTVSGIQVMFINFDVDFTSPMITAIQGLQTTQPFGFLLTEKQVRDYMQQQWYVGDLSQVVAYNNKVGTAKGYTAGTNKWADPIGNNSNNGEWAILKEPSFEDANMTLVEGELPAEWFPDIDPI